MENAIEDKNQKKTAEVLDSKGSQNTGKKAEKLCETTWKQSIKRRFGLTPTEEMVREW